MFLVDTDLLQGVKKIFGSEEKKEFVDPYFIAAFAGTKVCATVLFTFITVSCDLKLKKRQ